MIITIARQYGCGALQVAQCLASQLGLTLYTRRMLFDMARRRGLDAELGGFMDEEPVDNLLIALNDSGQAPPELTERLHHHFKGLIGSEHCVVVGRCGNSLFAHRSDLVSVFLKAPFEDRVAATAAAENLTPHEAVRLVRDTDERRAAYHHYYTGLTWGAAADYDLCLDALRLGPQATAALIEAYARHTLPTTAWPHPAASR
ncbi:MAG: cytidylate kinase-like family protein [Bacteroidales bacterium]|nr:cytidylate kinase-like family protein [Bacteroidales bacterium]